MENLHSVFMYVRLSVNLGVLKTLHIENKRRKFHPVFITNVFGFIDVLVRFCGQRSKVKVTAGNDPKT